MSNQNNKLNVGVVGATGMVGKVFLQLLQERNFPVQDLKLFASQKSAGQKISVFGKSYEVQELKKNSFNGLDLVFFSSGDDISKEWAPIAVQSGAYAIDNSAAFRMSEDVLLIVPEVNGHLLNEKSKPQIIANPNCTTIQMVVALCEVHKKIGIDFIRLASYQAVSGAGAEAYQELLDQTKQLSVNQGNAADLKPQVFPHPIAFNCIPQIGSINADGFSSEEMKVIKETKKILQAPALKVSAFTVRVPVLNAHAEAVWFTLKKQTSKKELLDILSKSSGVIVQDDPSKSIYPLQNQVSGKDPVYVGRIHQDFDDPMTWMMWIVGDNIRKGAALNGIQIAERIFSIS